MHCDYLDTLPTYAGTCPLYFVENLLQLKQNTLTKKKKKKDAHLALVDVRAAKMGK